MMTEILSLGSLKDDDTTKRTKEELVAKGVELSKLTLMLLLLLKKHRTDLCMGHL